MINILNRKKDVLKEFPQMALSIKEAEKLLNGGTCTTCNRNKILNNLLREYNDLVAKKIKDVQPRSDGITKEIRHKNHIEEIVQREACIECVIKHLSSGLVYIPEVVLGHNDHINNTISEIALASSRAPLTYKNRIEQVLGFLQKYKETKALEFLRQADKKIKDILSSVDRSKPITVYYLIGQLVHAEEECWKIDVDLAIHIRDERRKLQNDFNYVPNIAALLVQ